MCDQPSKVVAGVNNDNKPHKVPPPRLVPLTRSNVPSPSTLMMETPDPMLTSRHGSCGVGFPSNVTAYFGGLGPGRSSAASDGDACATDWISSSEKKYTSSGMRAINFN